MENSKLLEVVTPGLADLWFRESLMADEETMSYNHAWGGTIPFQKINGRTGMTIGSSIMIIKDITGI